jgi:hypothetical protein
MTKDKFIIDFTETEFITSRLIDLILRSSFDFHVIVKNANNNIIDILNIINIKDYDVKFIFTDKDNNFESKFSK